MQQNSAHEEFNKLDNTHLISNNNTHYNNNNNNKIIYSLWRNGDYKSLCGRAMSPTSMRKNKRIHITCIVKRNSQYIYTYLERHLR